MAQEHFRKELFERKIKNNKKKKNRKQETTVYHDLLPGFSKRRIHFARTPLVIST